MKMTSQNFIMNVNNTGQSVGCDTKPPLPKEKIMSYEEKSVGSTVFFKCEACPYMALAEDDIKFHLFTAHPDLAKTNGLADNIHISCPGCTSVFDAEETLRTHLRNHHKMGIKDVKKMVKSLVQIALKNAKLKKEDKKPENTTTNAPQDMADVKIPQVIEIVPNIVNPNNESLPKGVAYISVDELNHMSTPNFEKVDPKEVIQGASINIVYTNEAATQYMNVSNSSASNGNCNVIQVSSVTPDLISSIQPHISTVIDNNLPSPPTKKDSDPLTNIKPHVPSTVDDSATDIDYSHPYHDDNDNPIDDKKLFKCRIDGCHARLKDESNMAYHKKCHQNGKLQCPECGKICSSVDALHTHLWKIHALDMELPTCEICGFKTYKRHRLFNIHMKCHGKIRAYTCLICMKSFKNANQFSKHKLVHKKDPVPARCNECQKEFCNEQRLKVHVKMVHDKSKPFKCSQCDYTAARKTELKLHVRSHTGDKPYACNKCSYRAADHNAMRRHKRLHSKEGIYKCKHCPYTAIQSTMFSAHLLTKHPNVNSNDIHCCPYCPFKSLSKEKYLTHMTTHRDKEGVQFVDMKTGNSQVKPSWTIPSEAGKADDKAKSAETNGDSAPKTVNPIPIEVFDCDSLSESMPQEYPKKYQKPSCSSSKTFSNCVIVTDLSTDENNSDCLMSEPSNDTLIKRHQYNGQRPLQMNYDTGQSNLHSYLGTSVSMEQSLLQNNSVNSVSNHSQIVDSISNNIMGNFPIRLPPAPQLSVRNNIMLNPVDKLSLPMTKVIGPIIKPTQILPVPASSHSPINVSNENDGAPKKKAKISVKSNLILKGPDQVNMFHSQQKMAFRQLEDNERFGLGGPVTFNNLITTQFMQLQTEPVLSESPNAILTYPPENLLEDPVTTPVDSGLNDNAQIFNFNQQLNVNSMTMLPPAQKIQTNDPSYIKLEGAIKQNTQSPCLESMCNALDTQAISREYKASPPLEDLHRSMSEIKNEVKSDSFYTMALTDTASNPSIIDQYLMDNIIGEQYPSHIDLSTVVLPDLAAHDSDVIEIDDNSDDTKMLPRFDINFPLEPLYLMHNDFHFLEADMAGNVPEVPVNELNRLVGDVIAQETVEMPPQDPGKEFQKFVQGKKDPMMNTSVRPTTNKINVKNIELMKN